MRILNNLIASSLVLVALLLVSPSRIGAWEITDAPIFQKTLISNQGDGKIGLVRDVFVDDEDYVLTTDLYAWNVQKFDSNGNFIMLFEPPEGLTRDFNTDPRSITQFKDIYYVPDIYRSKIYKYDRHGNYLSTIDFKLDNGEEGRPLALAIHDDVMYISEQSQHKIYIYTIDGLFINSFGGLGSTAGYFHSPYNLKIKDDLLYIPEWSNHRIQVFDLLGNYQYQFGLYGNGDGFLNSPRGIDFDSNGNIYIAEGGSNRVQVFTPNWEFITKITGLAWAYDVSIDSLDNIYSVNSNMNQRIHKYSSNYTFLFSFGSHTSSMSDYSFRDPVRVFVDERYYVYIADSRNYRVLVYNPDGEQILNFGTYGAGDGEFNRPVGIATNPANGDIYVVDITNSRIQVFDKYGSFKFKWGTTGSGDGQFSNPASIKIKNNRAYVVEDLNNRVQVFDLEGNFLYKFGSYGTGDGQLNRPWGIAIDSQNRIIVSDERNHRIQVFSENGDFLFKFGSYGKGEIQFDTPHDVATDIYGNIFVADSYNNRIQVFSKDGELLYLFGGVPELYAPSSIFITPDNNIYILERAGAQRIKLYSHDRMSPSGSIRLNSDSAYTKSPDITAVTQATDDKSSVKNMRVSESSSFEGSLWIPYTQTVPLTLSSGDGTKTVYVQYEDEYTNFSEVYSDSVILDTQVPAVRINDIGQITDVPDRESLFYYFTSQTPTIRGITESNSTVEFTIKEYTYRTNSDSNGNYKITLVGPSLDRGKNVITYSSTDRAGNVSETRTLTLVIGEEYFPDWLFAKIVEEGGNIEDTDQSNEQDQIEEEISDGNYDEHELHSILVIDSDGKPLKDIRVIVGGKYYTTNSEGYIYVTDIETGILSYEIDGYKGTLEFDAGKEVNEIVVDILEDESVDEVDSLFPWLWVLMAILLLSGGYFVYRRFGCQ
jgi:tripartite motif-containing protein 71